MKQERRKIQVSSDLAISSVWRQAEPSGHCAAILAHGAGAGMDHEFITYFHERLAQSGISAVKFNFPYKERGRRAPDRAPLLEETFRAVIQAVRNEWAPERLFVGGKSMGGRMASHLAAEGAAVAGLFLLGYPLHPPGKPERMRREHLASITCPTLFIQGTRDSLCRLDLLRAELERMPARVELYVVEGGNHSFQVLKSMGRSNQEVLREIARRLTDWMKAEGGC